MARQCGKMRGPWQQGGEAVVARWSGIGGKVEWLWRQGGGGLEWCGEEGSPWRPRGQAGRLSAQCAWRRAGRPKIILWT